MENANDTQYNRLDEVKKLIFGEEIKSYNNQLDGLKKQMENYRTEISVKVDEVKIELFNAVETLEQKLIEKINQVQVAAKQDLEAHRQAHVSRQSLSNVFEQISKSLAQ
jgi:uncharacterized protein YcbK (DUF882 family)